MGKIISTIVAIVLALGGGYYVYTLCAPSFDEVTLSVDNPYAASISAQEGKNRDALSPDNQQLYDIVKGALINRTAEIVVKRDIYTPDDLMAVRNSIFYDSPELFWVDFSSLYFRDVNDGFVIIPTYFFEQSELSAKQQEFTSACEALAAEIKTAHPDDQYAQVLYLHDYLVKNVKYDLNADEKTIHTAYGAIINKAAVCDGYSHAFQCIADLLGIDSFFVEGKATTAKGETLAHAWNVVGVEGTYYYIDVTWDCCTGFSEAETRGNNLISHAYFLVNEEKMARAHTLDAVFETPACTTDYDYFGKLGLVGESFDALEEKITELTYNAVIEKTGYFELIITGENPTLSEDFNENVVTAVNKKLKSNKISDRVANISGLYEKDSGRCFMIVTLN